MVPGGLGRLAKVDSDYDLAWPMNLSTLRSTLYIPPIYVLAYVLALGLASCLVHQLATFSERLAPVRRSVVNIPRLRFRALPLCAATPLASQ
ncbi:hypothetical protein PsYK624_054370 [Phanerochaete sordida]|uniref:Uncharacterized protein n=1 Tax=Phanerochaete sordida TaxID=48140 RepID=A0A9P3LCL0_9APHY|nr:hypothetical protein PsYK624_054370 [Phanerochaete sordida]